MIRTKFDGFLRSLLDGIRPGVNQRLQVKMADEEVFGHPAITLKRNVCSERLVTCLVNL